MTIQTLCNLVHEFNPHEHLLLRYALKGSKEEGEENKSLQLFNLIAQETKVTREQASKAIYHTSPDTKINKLISRLWRKILHAITSDNFLEKSGRLNKQARSRIEVRKQILQCLVLGFMRGSGQIQFLIVEEAIKEARQTDYYPALIELYRLRKQSVMFGSNIKEYEFCNQQINYYGKCFDIQEKLLQYYNEITKDQGYGNSISWKASREKLEKALTELKKERKYMVSAYSKYMFKLIQLELLFLNEQFSKAKAHLKQILRTVNSSHLSRGNSHVKSRVENELGTCELFLNNYDKAIKHYEHSLLLLWGKNKETYYVTLVTLFHAVFYASNFTRAKKIVDEFLSEQKTLKNGFRNSKSYFFRACIHFKEKEYSQALKITNKSSALNKDKTGYDLAIRILRIQCLIALNRLDEASTQIENLRKHASRNSKAHYTSERNMLIIRTLVLMHKRGFTGKPNKTESELIKKLSSPSGEYKWKPLSPELIRFHEWYKEITRFESKLH